MFGSLKKKGDAAARSAAARTPVQPTPPTPPPTHAAKENHEVPVAGAVAEDPKMLAERRQALSVLRMSVVFTQCIQILIRSAAHKHLALSDLEWLLLPALANGQFRIAQLDRSRGGAPVALVLWALVSPEVEQRLMEAASFGRLQPHDWKSGSSAWVLTVAGERKAADRLLRELASGPLVGQTVKLKIGDGHGGSKTTTLTEMFGPQAAASPN